VLWRQNVAAELTSAVFTEESSCVLALGKGIFKVRESTFADIMSAATTAAAAASALPVVQRALAQRMSACAYVSQHTGQPPH
jgi:hypothetical protein